MLAERQFYRGAYILFQQLHVMVDCCKMWQNFTSSRACSGIVLKMETQEWMDPICLKWCSHLLCDFQTAHFLGQLISVIAHTTNQKHVGLKSDESRYHFYYSARSALATILQMWLLLSPLLIGALELGGLIVPLLPNQREDDEDGRDAWKVKSSIINPQSCIAFKLQRRRSGW